MKTLSPTLLAAQKKAQRQPVVEAKVYDFEAGIKRLSWTRVYEGSEPDAPHGIAFDGKGDMHRIRAAAGNAIYYQKLKLPIGTPSSFPLTFPIVLFTEPILFSQWTLIASNCFGPCAIAASGSRVYIFYRTTTNVLWKYYSHDYGATWTSAELVPYTEVVSLAACWWGTGNIVVCFALKAVYPARINGIVLNTDTQVATQREWFDGAHPLLETYGIGATFNPFWPEIEIVLAGRQSDSPYNHYDLFRTWFSDTYHFGGLESFLVAPRERTSPISTPTAIYPSTPRTMRPTASSP